MLIRHLESEPVPGGGELYLQAVASRAGGGRFLVLRSLPQALHTYQQLAHDFELEKEKTGNGWNRELQERKSAEPGSARRRPRARFWRR